MRPLVRSGLVNPNVGSSPYRDTGFSGRYWSSTPYSSSANYAYNLVYNTNVYPSGNYGNRYDGYSLRCLAR